jgi:hypothetical protein
MSTVSQTPAAASRLGFGRRFALAWASSPDRASGPARRLAPIATHGLPRGRILPDMALFAAQPLAIKIHLATALAALCAGAVLMWRARAAPSTASPAGCWVSLVSVTAARPLFITSLNHGRGRCCTCSPAGCCWSCRWR